MLRQFRRHELHAITRRIQSKKGCFSVWKILWTALRSHHAQFTRATSDKQTESGTNPRYSFGLHGTVYLLGPEPRAALDHATPRYSEESSRIHSRINNISVKSCEKHSNSAHNYIQATDIRINATDVETRKKNFYKHKSPWFTMDLT